MQAHSIAERLNRRRFIARLAAVGASAAGLTVLGGCGFLASPAPHVPRMGFVFPRPMDARIGTQIDAFRTGLLDYGYAEGRNIQIEWRFSTSPTHDNLPAVFAELIALPVDLIAVSFTPVAQIAKQATSTIPIIGVAIGNPVEVGLVESLARPGRNVTALSSSNSAFQGKRLELVRHVVPDLTHMGYLYSPGNDGNVVNLNEFRHAADKLGVAVRPIELRTLDDLEPGVAEAVQAGVEALYSASSSGLARTVAVTLRHGLPNIGSDRTWPEAGGLMSAGSDMFAIYRRAGYYVDRILKGTSPSELPVEQPTEVEVVVNLTTAQALGLTIPPNMAAQVTAWVQ
jgi:putative tryptophan/tyrosine transport system substrate-binding protein